MNSRTRLAFRPVGRYNRGVHLFMPFASSILYVVAALFLKQAAGQGVGVWRTAFVCNWLTAFLFLALLPMGGQIPENQPFWEPAIVAMLFVAGQLFTFLALEKGDVSVATPIMGAKVILVALFTTLLVAVKIPLTLWLAAGFSCLGIGFLNRNPGGMHRHVGRTIWFALQAAASYALFDVLVMTWAPDWGAGRFLPLVMVFGGLFSFIFVPLFRGSLLQIPKEARRPLAGGAFFIALQAIILVTALAQFGDATAVNVIYSTRGLWSVLAVWWFGKWFANRERELGEATMRLRLVGAAFLCAAVILVFV